MTSLASTTPIERPASLKDTAYRQIKQLLLAGKLDGDRFYSAQHFAEILGVSRTPVREALLQLANEGLLTCLDVRGFKLREFSPRDVRDVFETRQVIEVYVCERMAADLTAADLQAMEATLAAMQQCMDHGDPLGFLEADREFHMIPIRRGGNRNFVTILDNIRDHICILGRVVLEHAGRNREILREHAAILKALKRKDKKAAVKALKEHLNTTEGYLPAGNPDS
ncbi:MAG: GntR family transcriptional regulator [Gemmataceae bacterium]